MAPTLSGLTTTPDQVGQRAEPDPHKVGHCVEDVTASVRQRKVLDKLTDRSMQREYAQSPRRADACHQRCQCGAREDADMDHLVQPGALWSGRSLR